MTTFTIRSFAWPTCLARELLVSFLTSSYKQPNKRKPETGVRRSYGKSSKHRRTSDPSNFDSVPDWAPGFLAHRRFYLSRHRQTGVGKLHRVLHLAGWDNWSRRGGCSGIN